MVRASDVGEEGGLMGGGGEWVGENMDGVVGQGFTEFAPGVDKRVFGEGSVEIGGREKVEAPLQAFPSSSTLNPAP